MKRILPLILTVLLLPTLLAMPARADEMVEWNGVIDILDYGYSLSNNSNYFSLASDGNERQLTVAYANPNAYKLLSVDIIFYTDDTSPRIGTQSAWLRVISLGNGLYRAYGADGRQGSQAEFGFWYSDGTFFEVLSYKASTYSLISYEAVASGIVYDYSTSPATQSAISYKGDGQPSGTVELGSTSYQGGSFRVDLDLYDWRSFDYIQLSMSSFCSSIDSIQVLLDGVNVPYQVNYLDLEHGSDTGLALIDISIDCRNINRFSSSNIVVQVSGLVGSPRTGNFVIQHCLGNVAVEPPSALSFWFTSLHQWLDVQTQSIVGTISSWGQNIVNALGGNNDASGVQDNINAAVGELDQVQGVLDGVSRPDLDAIDFDVSGLVDVSAAATYGNIFSTLIGNQYMTNILMIAFILAAASFLLFGRR